MQEKRNSRSILDKTVVTKSGKKFGKVSSLAFESRTGEIMNIILKEPTSYIDHLDIEQDKQGNWLVPFSSVIAVGDFVVVAEEDII
tara:strand:+ start:4788 stop:5045 length:258 start_codon:yes stop_codon:yes gene_type:complete